MLMATLICLAKTAAKQQLNSAAIPQAPKWCAPQLKLQGISGKLWCFLAVFRNGFILEHPPGRSLSSMRLDGFAFGAPP